MNNLDNEEFQLWKDHPITQAVIKLHQERKDDVLEYIQDAAIDGTVLSEADQVRFHERLAMYQDFIQLDYQDIEDSNDEDDTARMGKGVSQTG